MINSITTRRGLLTAAAVLAMSGAASAQQSYKIGLSNGWVGSEWRTQMIEEAQAAAAAWKAKGVNVEVVVQSSTVDVQGQIGHVRNFVNQGVNAIIINPNSPTAFDPVFARPRRETSSSCPPMPRSRPRTRSMSASTRRTGR